MDYTCLHEIIRKYSKEVVHDKYSWNEFFVWHHAKIVQVENFETAIKVPNMVIWVRKKFEKPRLSAETYKGEGDRVSFT